MQDAASSWDWQPGERVILDSTTCGVAHQWQEEPYVSPDGERLAAVVRLDDDMFSMCVNGKTWESSFEKLWKPVFGPDGRLVVIAQQDGEWTLAVDGAPWEEFHAYLWRPCFSMDGSVFDDVPCYKDVTPTGLRKTDQSAINRKPRRGGIFVANGPLPNPVGVASL